MFLPFQIFLLFSKLFSYYINESSFGNMQDGSSFDPFISLEQFSYPYQISNNSGMNNEKNQLIFQSNVHCNTFFDYHQGVQMM